MVRVSPKIFQVGDKFGIRSEAMVPGAGRIDGPDYSIVVPVEVLWAGDSWSRVVFREFPNRETAEEYLAANMRKLIARAEKQFGTPPPDPTGRSK